VLVRFLLRDEPAQARAAKAAIDRAIQSGEPMVLGLLAVLETEWVLRSRAGLDKAAVLTTFKQLLEARDLAIEREDVLEQALYAYENSSADFADCLMVASYVRSGCSAMLTFDARATKLPGCERLRA
jgi:predicted nucleic-acid-binding protein